jgi:hypothetical protein
VLLFAFNLLFRLALNLNRLSLDSHSANSRFLSFSFSLSASLASSDLRFQYHFYNVHANFKIIKLKTFNYLAIREKMIVDRLLLLFFGKIFIS